VIASAGFSPARASMSCFRCCVKDVDGRTVAVQPDTQIVVWMVASVTSAKRAPGGSTRGERWGAATGPRSPSSWGPSRAAGGDVGADEQAVSAATSNSERTRLTNLLSRQALHRAIRDEADGPL
jgi:hypothetical protein